MATAEDLKVKRIFIEAFLDNLDQKIRFLDELVEQGHGDEARLLCTTYLDGLANWLYLGRFGSAQNFSRLLADHGGEIVLALVVPESLIEELPWGSAPKGARVAIKAACRSLPPNEALTSAELMDALRATLSPEHAAWLEREVWRGSVANAVYARIRSRGVHWLGAAQALVFSKTSFQGRPLPCADFEMLMQALRRVFASAKELSLRTNKWIGVS